MDKKLLTGILVLCSLYVGFVIYACTKIYIDDKDMSNIDLIAAYDSDKYLTKSTDERDALLIKREVGSVQPDKSKPPQNVPNIYVLNKEGYEQEIKWALEKIVQLYGTDEFYPFVKGNNQK